MKVGTTRKGVKIDTNLFERLKGEISVMLLVTGGAGYIGSHCVLKLLGSYDVVVFDSLELGHKETVDVLKNPRLKFIKGTLQNYDDISGVFRECCVDTVIHFAAYSQVSESVKDPQKYYFNNVYGTLNLLKAMLEFGVKHIVFSSTAATYGEPQYTPIDENHQQIPVNPYGRSKLMVENILDDYDKAYGIKSIRLRYFNVIGADSESRIGEWHEPETHLVPNILASTSSGKSFKLFGDNYNTEDGTCVRDYIDVEDLAQAHVLALEYLKKFEKTDVFNLGTNSGNTVKEVFKACEEVTKSKIPLQVVDRRDGDPEILVANNLKARNVLGWSPSKSLKESIKNAYKWILK